MRIEPELSTAYRKNLTDEEFIQHLNNLLAAHQEAEYQAVPDRLPMLFIVGAPRAGTTLLHQLVCSCLDVGFINNLMAVFWKAPIYGIRLSQKLMPTRQRSSFHSDFGRTNGLHEPHEFGYFWSSALNYHEMRERDPSDTSHIDWNRVHLLLTNITHTFNRPTCFKSLLLNWHIQDIQHCFEHAVFLHIQRDPIDNALSLIKFREQFLGDIHRWVSLKPREFEWLQNEPYPKQVAGQVFFIDQRLREALRHVPSDQQICLSYADLCTAPASILDRVQALLDRLGFPTIRLFEPPDHFRLSKAESSEDAHFAQVRDAVTSFYST